MSILGNTFISINEGGRGVTFFFSTDHKTVRLYLFGVVVGATWKGGKLKFFRENKVTTLMPFSVQDIA